MPKFKVVLTAGGTSRRFGSANKLFEDLNGKPVIKYSVDLFSEMGFEIVIPSHNSAMAEMQELFALYPNVRIIQGGLTRQQSVFRGLKECGDAEYVIIHDAARPLIKKETVQKALDEVVDKKAVIVAVKTTDTIKTVDIHKKITSTPSRTNLINVQTPQVFEYQMILDAHARHQDKSFTDDACLIEESGLDVYYVEGDYSNIKITNQIDIAYAKILLESE